MRWVWLLFVLGLGVEAWGGCPGFLSGVDVGTVEDGRLTEISGMVASVANPGVFWVHNDSGGGAEVYAMDAEGRHLGVFGLSGASAVDWEDIAIGPGPIEGEQYLYAGDIGDNSGVRSEIVVYRVLEPEVAVGQSPVSEVLTGVERIRLTYPDGARDAEVLLVDPVTRDLCIVSKRESLSRVYTAGYPQSTSSATVMTYRGELTWGWTTGGDVSADGSLVLVRGYISGMVYRREVGMALWEAFGGEECEVPVIAALYEEAICFDGQGCGYYTVREGVNQPIYYFGRDGECPLEGDVDRDGEVTLADLGVFGGRWLDGGCARENFGCGWCDVDGSGEVDLVDFGYLAGDWK